MIKKGEDQLQKLTDKEINLINMIHDTDFGEIKIIIQDKQPVRVEELKRSIKL